MACHTSIEAQASGVRTKQDNRALATFGHLLGSEIGKARTALGWTQEHVAVRAFNDEDQVRAVRRYETLKTKNPRPKTFVPICEALGITHERIFNLVKASDNKESVDVSYLEELGHIIPSQLAQRIRENDMAEDAACDLHHLIVINHSSAAIEALEDLMADPSLRLVLLDYFFRYYHFAFRSKLRISAHKSAILFLEELL